MVENLEEKESSNEDIEKYTYEINSAQNFSELI